MSHVPDESPVEEYERQAAALRKRVEKRLHWCYAATVVPYVASWMIGLWPGGGSPIAFFSAVGVAIALAMVTGFVTFWHWTSLSWGMRLYGLAPWAFFALVAFPAIVSR
jgi:hypothetical protein